MPTVARLTDTVKATVHRLPLEVLQQGLKKKRLTIMEIIPKIVNNASNSSPNLKIKLLSKGLRWKLFIKKLNSKSLPLTLIRAAGGICDFQNFEQV
jgi:hypothetical protein